MKRREFMGIIGGAAVALPGIARAQRNAMPSIGFLSTGSSAESGYLAFTLDQNGELRYARRLDFDPTRGKRFPFRSV